MSVVRLTEWPKTFVGNAIGGVNAVRLVDVTDVLPRSTCKYSTFADHRPAKAYSAPTPAVQPTLVSEMAAASSAVAKLSVKRKLALTFATARPPVTYSSQLFAANPSP